MALASLGSLRRGYGCIGRNQPKLFDPQERARSLFESAFSGFDDYVATLCPTLNEDRYYPARLSFQLLIKLYYNKPQQDRFGLIFNYSISPFLLYCGRKCLEDTEVLESRLESLKMHCEKLKILIANEAGWRYSNVRNKYIPLKNVLSELTKAALQMMGYTNGGYGKYLPSISAEVSQAYNIHR